MRTSFLLAAIAAMFVVCNPSIGGDKQVDAKPLILSLSLCEGDPLGSREAGTIKVLAQPKVVTRQNAFAELVSGGELANSVGIEGTEFVPTGLTVKCMAAVVKDGKVKLDLTFSVTTPGEQSTERIQLHTQSTRTITIVKLGEVIKLRCGKADPGKQFWIEVSVDVCEQ